MLLGHFTKLQNYNVPVSWRALVTIQFAKRIEHDVRNRDNVKSDAK